MRKAFATYDNSSADSASVFLLPGGRDLQAVFFCFRDDHGLIQSETALVAYDFAAIDDYVDRKSG